MGGGGVCVNFEDICNSSASFSLLIVKNKIEHSILEGLSGDLYLESMKQLKLFAKCYALSHFSKEEDPPFH